MCYRWHSQKPNTFVWWRSQTQNLKQHDSHCQALLQCDWCTLLDSKWTIKHWFGPPPKILQLIMRLFCSFLLQHREPTFVHASLRLSISQLWWLLDLDLTQGIYIITLTQVQHLQDFVTQTDTLNLYSTCKMYCKNLNTT